MRNLEAQAWKDGKYWLIELEIEGKQCMTQARNLREIQTMANDLAACYGVDNPHVNISFRDPAFQQAIDAYKTASCQARQAQDTLSLASREAVRLLRKNGVSVRDAAAVLDLSPGRVSQLAS